MRKLLLYGQGRGSYVACWTWGLVTSCMKTDSRCAGPMRLLSDTIAETSSVSTCLDRTHAAATTGPASGPRPASSTPGKPSTSQTAARQATRSLQQFREDAMGITAVRPATCVCPFAHKASSLCSPGLSALALAVSNAVDGLLGCPSGIAVVKSAGLSGNFTSPHV